MTWITRGFAVIGVVTVAWLGWTITHKPEGTHE